MFHSKSLSDCARRGLGLRYHIYVHLLAQRVLKQLEQQELLRAGDRVGVAVSGGIDSVALLRLLLELRGELGIVLAVVHFNHRLRAAESDRDQQFVENVAREHDLEFYVDSDDVAEQARTEGLSVETAARELRYGFFRSLVQNGPEGLKPCGEAQVEIASSGRSEEPHPPYSRLNKIVTGHTLDDQAETVLMRLIRGAGLKGIGGIYPRMPIEDDDGEVCGDIVRPLLGVRRGELEQYLKEIGQTWREDATNNDPKFTRNRVRKLIMPLLENDFNPAVAENLSELAEIARGEEDYWENEVAGWMGTGVHWSEPSWAKMDQNTSLVQISPKHDARDKAELRSKINDSPWLVMNASVDRLWFLGEPLAVQRRLVKAVGEYAGFPLEFKHVQQVLKFASEEGGSGKEIALPLGWTLVREPQELIFLTPDLRGPGPVQDYEYELTVPGEVTLLESGSSIEARQISAGSVGYNPEQLLDADSLSERLKVRNWRAGDRFWPAHTKSPKKVKELLQERHVAQPERRLWPVVVSGDEIVWVRGFPVPSRWHARPDSEAVLIVEKPLKAEVAENVAENTRRRTARS